MENAHQEFFSKLWRCATIGETKMKTINIEKSLEFKILQIYKNYLGFDNFCSERDKIFFDTVMKNYILKLYYLPNTHDLESLFLRISHVDPKNFKTVVNNHIYLKNDFKYLKNCIVSFDALSDDNKVEIRETSGPRIKYYGPIGTSGYAKMTRNIVESLIECCNIQFQVLQFHNYGSPSDFDITLSALSKNILPEYEFVVLHSMPDLWPTICKMERAKNEKVKIYGISVWELDSLPKKWRVYTQFVDKISTPSDFASESFRKIFPNVDTVHHPLKEYLSAGQESCCEIKTLNLKQKFSYIFYNISEFSNRKGVMDLIYSFANVDLEYTALYIKTFGCIPEDEIRNFIDCNFEKSITSRIFLDFKKVDDNYISCIHSCGDCYVSLSKSEGHGIGICEASIAQNFVITTGYGAQLEYLLEPEIVSFSMAPATLCSVWSESCKKNCGDLPHCKNFDGFLPSLHSWAQPDLHDCTRLMTESAISHKKGTMKQRSYILENFNQKVFSKNLINSLLSTKKRDETLRRESIIKYIYELETKEPIYDQKSLGIIKTETRKKVIINIAASKYGNVGDNCIAEVIKKHFEKNFTIIQVPDIFVNTVNGLKYYQELLDDLVDPIILPIFDAMIIGGGGVFRKGILAKKSSSSCSIEFYVNYCIEKKIPYYIVGTGFQDVEINTDITEFKSEFKDYQKILENADFISLRSVSDYHFGSVLLSSNNKLKMNFFPDVVYSFANFFPLITYPRKFLLVLPTKNWIKLEHNYVIHTIRKELESDPDLELVFMEMGGSTDASIRDVLNTFPNAKIYSGMKIEYEEIVDKNRNLQIQEVWEIFCQTKIILTGRYHGLVLGRAAKVPKIETFGYCNYKFLADEYSNLRLLNIDEVSNIALHPLIIIEDMIEKGKVNFQNWTEDDRNSHIVKLHETEHYDIEILQNWNNLVLENTFEKV